MFDFLKLIISQLQVVPESRESINYREGEKKPNGQKNPKTWVFFSPNITNHFKKKSAKFIEAKKNPKTSEFFFSL